MTELNVDTESVRSFGVHTESRGTSVAVEGHRGEFNTAAMGAVFGLIGADFMAVASLVTNNHNRQVTAIGERYTKIGRAVAAAANAYTSADADNAGQFGNGSGATASGAASNLASGLDPASQKLTKEQVAKIIIDRGKKMGMSDDEIKSALATGLVESNLQNLDYGDRDSVGVFQQRNFEPWTSGGRNRMNVDQAATSYYEQLKGTSGAPGDRAQAVQRSAFPDRYNERMAEASSLYSSLATAAPVTTTTTTATPTTTPPGVTA
ncbi:type VII secretion target [Gordonia sp. CPCC 206044]|uniref:type VII secretion target n=1 Tax=Gordonia sp. CPCC 206044 TaxID=3140793 RepID=UPI003AF3D9E0